MLRRAVHAGWSLSLLIACGSPQAARPKADDEAASKSDLAQAQVAQAQVAPAAPATGATPAANAAAQPVDVNAALAYDPADPLANLEAADALDRMAQGGQQRDVKPPPGGCAVADGGRRVWPASGPAAIVGLGDGFVIAGYAVRDGREQLFVVHLPQTGLPEPITAFDIAPKFPRERTAPPGLSARDDNDISVAFTNGEGKLFVRRLRVGRGGGSAAVEIASGVDTRFAPAVAHREDRTLVAWTEGKTPMRVQLAVLSSENQPIAKHDVTPESMGASAPTFVAGASPPVLVAVDARNGYSPLLRIDIGNDGTPQKAVVALPLSTVATPPQLAAASSSTGTHVAYAGMGAAASSAIGLVAIAPVVGTPEALIKGVYGQLRVTATAAPRAVLIAVDAPAKAPPSAAKDPALAAGKVRPSREIRVTAVGLKGASQPVVIAGPAHHAEHAGIARDGEGHVGVAYSDGAGIYVASLKCDDE